MWDGVEEEAQLHRWPWGGCRRLWREMSDGQGLCILLGSTGVSQLWMKFQGPGVTGLASVLGPPTTGAVGTRLACRPAWAATRESSGEMDKHGRRGGGGWMGRLAQGGRDRPLAACWAFGPIVTPHLHFHFVWSRLCFSADVPCIA